MKRKIEKNLCNFNGEEDADCLYYRNFKIQSLNGQLRAESKVVIHTVGVLKAIRLIKLLIFGLYAVDRK